ncbi:MULTISPECIES: flagellar basal body rod protein FlgC [Rhizobium/Agrobacterium group]|uniref:Flagellar basal-body rod protein FlgC n=2 Tax=Rhizobium/Agrobacterium group TaxID=227290 RepID=B9JRP4_ALLAM|nr:MULTISPECIES: flagellar basal body rod protein FlgC [Rhizobium/Agrobacterium group]ACM35520.1 flagellar basal-body rod protein [Allorhizobium ampelinum S4]MBF2717172.1 flagellar basal body rod protein FlgC [Agrobacterium vitis]MCF1449534.1 flagellar basal body rod protein FlgC [Allorhizobium ampelinum]MCF1496084.1 flagellar basal body rod protein FlgC [Allorhizobium ampelinum]MUO29545.1 flagellar basal body rod protein FlgC [Agrobacterium vitis]
MDSVTATDPLTSALKIAGSGLDVQSTRLRIVSENIANAQSTGDTPGANPYRRKTITFGSEMDRATGTEIVKVKKLGFDKSNFTEEYDPSNPAADAKGYVKMPNVNVLIEMADMREANRTYEANLQSVKQTRDLITSTLDLLKSSQ